jgi:hypothetical protein
MSLPPGNWLINSNGFEGYLVIDSVDAAGRVEGSLMLIGASHVSGFWNEGTQELVFAPVAPEGAGIVLPIFYRGYLFSSPATLQPGQDFIWNLSGFFQMLDTTDLHIANVPTPNSRRNKFGWFAKYTAIV